MIYDVAVIGGGVTGCAIARELSRYRLAVCLIERENDVGCGSSKANSGIVHAGYDPEPGTLKAKLNREGRAMFEALSGELRFAYRKTGALVLAFHRDESAILEKLKLRGEQNGCEGLRIIAPPELRELEPNASAEAVAALYAPDAGIACPYEMTWALAENAAANGVALFTECGVTAIGKREGLFVITAAGRVIHARYVVNAAGLFADEISRMAGAEDYAIQPRKGEYCLLDKQYGGLINHVLFQTPTALGKGVLVTPTVDGNILIGPNAVDVSQKDGTETTAPGLSEVLASAKRSIPGLPERGIIHSFAGLRATAGGDFIIEASGRVRNLIHAAGMSSPGLTAAPAVANAVRELLSECGLQLSQRDDFQPYREGIVRFAALSDEEKAEIIRKNPRYGQIVCRCETVTEGEVAAAVGSIVGAKDLDGVKRRVRAGMGRCQGGFCSPKVLSVIAEMTGIGHTSVTKSGTGSELLTRRTRGGEG